MKKNKSKKSFPDMSGDGKVTKKDILMARGVIKKRKGYPKCVPLAKARAMSEGQRRSAVKRKRAAGNTGPKPKNVKTFTRSKK